MPSDPAFTALEKRVATLETTIKELTAAIKVSASSLQISAANELTIKTAGGGQIRISGPMVNVNNGALEVI